MEVCVHMYILMLKDLSFSCGIAWLSYENHGGKVHLFLHLFDTGKFHWI